MNERGYTPIHISRAIHTKINQITRAHLFDTLDNPIFHWSGIHTTRIHVDGKLAMVFFKKSKCRHIRLLPTSRHHPRPSRTYLIVKTKMYKQFFFLYLDFTKNILHKN